MPVHERQSVPSFLQIDAILGRLRGTAALAEVCRFLRREFRHYRWVGIYRREGAVLVLDAWDGDQPTEHTRIPIDRGICGQAVREGRTVVVADVREAPDYLACFRETRSEIVVPIRIGSEIAGEIDIDGDSVGAYDATDRAFLERLAPKLAGPLADAARLTGAAGPTDRS